jgi:hypothetical protein
MLRRQTGLPTSSKKPRGIFERNISHDLCDRPHPFARRHPRLANVGQFTERLPAELLLVVDIAGGGVELIVAQQN